VHLIIHTNGRLRFEVQRLTHYRQSVSQKPRHLPYLQARVLSEKTLQHPPSVLLKRQLLHRESAREEGNMKQTIIRWWVERTTFHISSSGCNSNYMRRILSRIEVRVFCLGMRTAEVFQLILTSISRPDIDKPPFQVTETGWGEFDVQIKIIFVPESGEKPLTTYHRLKLHPWHPVAIRAPETTIDTEMVADTTSELTHDMVPKAAEAADPSHSQVEEKSFDEDNDSTMQVDVKQEEEDGHLDTMAQTPMEAAAAGSSLIKHPPVVHSWSYDEIVFPEPTEAFYEILLANPPTP
jgi:hypothetical protein